jgi:pimeloyl-ACP methyl ester carboxylesterase
MSATFDPTAATVPPPDHAAEPSGFVVLVEPNDRIHFLDWGGPPDAPGVLLVHGIGQTAWVWTPVARRLRAARRVVAMDLRGHGLSDAPTEGYDEPTLVDDVLAVADGSGLLGRPIVLAGHGFGGVVASWAAAALAERCAGLVLVDGGWEDLPAATGLEPHEFLRGLEEPPEVLSSMTAFLADRSAFDPPTWDADQEQAARATVVETQAGRVVPATRPHALAGVVRALFDYRPLTVLSRVPAPVVVLAAAEDEAGTRGPALEAAQASRSAAGLPRTRVHRYPGDGHNLMRYRAADVTAAIMEVDADPSGPPRRSIRR